jgi:hypothetical protein
MKELIKKLEAIAEKNNDIFRYRINIEKRANNIIYDFEAIETADKHTFTGGAGYSIEECVEKTLKSIPDACKSWGYKE